MSSSFEAPDEEPAAIRVGNGEGRLEVVRTRRRVGLGCDVQAS
jgi:hypothetical protein